MLLRFVKGIPAEPGINHNLMELITVKAKSLNLLAKYCIITLDEMSLRQEMTYNPSRDEVEGLVDLGQKESAPCNQALVFMARGIATKWKQPLSFHFSRNAAPAKDLKRLLMLNLTALFQTGMKPVAVVCDQGSCNRSLYYQHLGVTKEQPFFDVSM